MEIHAEALVYGDSLLIDGGTVRVDSLAHILDAVLVGTRDAYGASRHFTFDALDVVNVN
jgi:hypothetical protein